MKKLSFVISASAALIVCEAQTGSAQIQQAWVAKYNNGISNANHQGLKMSLDSGGNIYVLGVSANANTNTGYVVLKYSATGIPVWSARYDSTNFPNAAPTGFALDSRNAVVVTGNAVTVKYDANGNELWTAPYNASGIGMDSGQNAYITGVSNNYTTLKLNSLGSNLWTRILAGSQYASQSVVVDSLSNVYVAGKEINQIKAGTIVNVVTVKYNKDGTQLWIADTGNLGGDYDAQIVGLVVDRSESVYVEANYFGTSYGPYTTYKYSSDASEGKSAGDPTDDLGSSARALVLDNVGNLIVTGGNDYYYPNNRYGTYKLDSNLVYLGTNLYPAVPTGNSVGTSLIVDSVNSVYVTGFATTSPNTSTDIATIKYDSAGNQLWVQRYDGPGHGNDAGNAIAVDNSGNVYVAGYETETNGFTSMILIKYAPVTGQKQSNGNFILHAYGSPGESFDLQASTNLQTWQDLGSFVADTNGVALFEDTNAPLFPNRFYYTVPQ